MSDYDFVIALLMRRAKADDLIKHGANVDAKNDDGWTALHQATLGGYLNFILILLKAGANINEKNKHGNTALHLAANEGYLECVIALLEAGANINEENNNKKTPFDECSDETKVLIRKWLDDNAIPIIKEPEE